MPRLRSGTLARAAASLKSDFTMVFEDPMENHPVRNADADTTQEQETNQESSGAGLLS